MKRRYFAQLRHDFVVHIYKCSYFIKKFAKNYLQILNNVLIFSHNKGRRFETTSEIALVVHFYLHNFFPFSLIPSSVSGEGNGRRQLLFIPFP